MPRRWHRLRKLTQAAAMLLFFSLFVTTYQASAGWWAGLFVRLDPLLALTATLAGRTLAAGFWLALFTVLLTVVFGRAWCGWLCPLGTLLDWLQPRPQRVNRRRTDRLPQPPERWRVAKYVLLLVVLFAALLGNQSLLVLDPITLLTRTLAGALWPALSYAVYQTEAFLYGFERLWPLLDGLHAAVVYPLFRDVQATFIQAVPIFLFFALIVALNGWVERFWCRYLCPLGGLLGLIAKGALLRRTVGAECKSCALCTHHCPTGTIDPQAGFRSDPAECIVCYDCLVDCPQDGIAFRWQRAWRPAAWQAYDPRRREVVTALGVAAVGVSLAGAEPVTRHAPPLVLRPPGAQFVAFSDLCIRCGECVRACPTQGLQASLVEGGWQNLFTPRLAPRLGYCLYSCQACSQVCPTGAIPALTLAEKQRTPIGLARVDRDRCLPWAYATPCIVCEEMCPIPDKAIRLEEVIAVDGQGQPVTLQRPSVIKERCIGCGICEYQCPMGGEAAIRVFAQP